MRTLMKLAYSFLANTELLIATRVLKGLPITKTTIPKENNDQASSLCKISLPVVESNSSPFVVSFILCKVFFLPNCNDFR